MKANKPISIRLDSDELNKIDSIAKEQGVSRSNLIHASIRYYLNKETYKNQNQAKENVRVDELIRRIYSMESMVRNTISRVNMINRQVDSTIQRVAMLEKKSKESIGGQKKLTGN